MTRILLLTIAGICGCRIPNLTIASPTSHTVPPSQTIERLGPSTGTASKVCGVGGFVDEHPDELMIREATRAAIESIPDADALIDVITSSHVDNYGLFSMCSVEIAGIAVRLVSSDLTGRI
jgi:hypothetical protein